MQRAIALTAFPAAAALKIWFFLSFRKLFLDVFKYQGSGYWQGIRRVLLFIVVFRLMKLTLFLGPSHASEEKNE